MSITCMINNFFLDAWNHSVKIQKTINNGCFGIEEHGDLWTSEGEILYIPFYCVGVLPSQNK